VILRASAESGILKLLRMGRSLNPSSIFYSPKEPITSRIEEIFSSRNADLSPFKCAGMYDRDAREPYNYCILSQAISVSGFLHQVERADAVRLAIRAPLFFQRLRTTKLLSSIFCRACRGTRFSQEQPKVCHRSDCQDRCTHPNLDRRYTCRASRRCRCSPE
jgi:hypothetical protein